MINKVTDSKWAYHWAKYIGNKDVMKTKITGYYYINLWNYYFIDDQITA